MNKLFTFIGYAAIASLIYIVWQFWPVVYYLIICAFGCKI